MPCPLGFPSKKNRGGANHPARFSTTQLQPRPPHGFFVENCCENQFSKLPSRFLLCPALRKWFPFLSDWVAVRARTNESTIRSRRIRTNPDRCETNEHLSAYELRSFSVPAPSENRSTPEKQCRGPPNVSKKGREYGKLCLLARGPPCFSQVFASLGNGRGGLEIMPEGCLRPPVGGVMWSSECERGKRQMSDPKRLSLPPGG